MPLTLAPTRPLLGFICVCLMFANADVKAEREKMQLKQEVQDDEPQSIAEKLPNIPAVPVFPPHLLNQSMRKPNYSLPIVSKGDNLYYDLTGVNVTELVIKKNSDSVIGITASFGECKVRSLHLRITYLLDEDLLTHCPQLSLKLEDVKWQCVQLGPMFERQGVDVDMTLAKCADVWDDSEDDNSKVFRYRMQEGIQKLKEFGITKCTGGKCMCRWYFKGDAYKANVDCERVGLTDDTLPSLPSHVRQVRLEGNALRSMDKLIQHLMPHNHTLEIIFADDNQMQTLPRLPNGTFPRLALMKLLRNKIEEIDIDAFEELVARENFVILLEDNPFRCDCLMYRFKKILQQHCMRGSHVCVRTYTGLECKYENENRTIPVHEVSQNGCTGLDWSQVDWWLVGNICLSLLNVFMIYLMLDLISIVTNMGGRNGRRPMIDCVLCALKNRLCSLSSWRPVKTIDED